MSVSLTVLYCRTFLLISAFHFQESHQVTCLARQTVTPVSVIAMRRELVLVNSDLFVDWLANTTSHPENQQRNICSFWTPIQSTWIPRKCYKLQLTMTQCCCACPATLHVIYSPLTEHSSSSWKPISGRHLWWVDSGKPNKKQLSSGTFQRLASCSYISRGKYPTFEPREIFLLNVLVFVITRFFHLLLLQRRIMSSEISLPVIWRCLHQLKLFHVFEFCHQPQINSPFHQFKTIEPNSDFTLRKTVRYSPYKILRPLHTPECSSQQHLSLMLLWF